MFKTLRWRLAPLVVLAAILAIPLIQHGWRLHSLDQMAQAAAAEPRARGTIAGNPVRIVVPSAAIDLPIIPGSQDVRTKVWSVAPDKANYATTTAPANNRSGQTLIYGHNNRHVFESLLGLKPGDKAVVYSDNNHVFTYTFTGAHDVTPDQGSIFETMKHGTGLVLMTCDGDHFQYRHLMSFRLDKAA